MNIDFVGQILLSKFLHNFYHSRTFLFAKSDLNEILARNVKHLKQFNFRELVFRPFCHIR